MPGAETTPDTALHHVNCVAWTPSAVVSLAVSSDGSLAAVARENGEVELWETHTWECLQASWHSDTLE